MDRDALGEVGGLYGAAAEAVGHRQELRRILEVTHVVVDRPSGLREAVTCDGRARLVVVLDHDRHIRVRLVEDLVEQVRVLGMNVQLEDAAVALQPRPRDDAVAVAPEADLPLVLAALVLPQAPGNVAHVPRRTEPAQAPLLESELLHPCDDLRCESHV